MDAALIARIVEAVEHLMVDRYANTAGATVWFYDYLLTFSAECEYIWTKKWSLVKILYLLNRYLTPPFLILVLYHLDGEQRGPLSIQFCVFYDIAATVLRWIQLLTSTWLILIVVQSLSLDKPCFKYFLYFTFFVMLVVTAVFAVLTLKEMYPTIEYLVPFKVCSSVAPDSTRWLYLTQVPFDVLLFLIELFYYWRLHRLIAPAQPTKLLSAMYLDGVWYFLATITVKFAAALVIAFAAPTYWYIASSADQAFTSTFIARLILHLRSVASPSSPEKFVDVSASSQMFSGTTSTGPKTRVPDREQGDVRRLKGQGGHDEDESFFARRNVDVSEGQWCHREGDGDAVEMAVRAPKKTVSASRCIFGR